jgi:DNA-binding transcriptional LysR family regulator
MDERVGRRLLRDLHIFMAVVERGTLARSASSLAMSQPAVSKAIADMEHTLGLRLLDRSRQGSNPQLRPRACQARVGCV